MIAKAQHTGVRTGGAGGGGGGGGGGEPPSAQAIYRVVGVSTVHVAHGMQHGAEAHPVILLPSFTDCTR